MKMTMKNIRENLERSYQLFLNRQQPLDFFNDIAGYLDYVFSLPELRGGFVQQLEKRNSLYEQKWKLEKQAMAEIREAKQKIEKILKKRKIDPKTLQRFRTSPIFAHSDSSIMQEWDDYEKGRIQTGDGGSLRCNRRSDDYNDLVGDMAANLYTRRYKDDVNEFLVSDEEYRTYYRRINGSGIISRTSDPNGNFVFSQALPERWEVENLIQTERYAKPWGAFEKLYQFWIAHKNISRGVSAEGTLEEVARALEEMKETDDGKYVIGPDSYDILSMQIDFRDLLGERSHWHQYRISNWKPNRLVVDQIKSAAETVHNILLQAAEQTGEPQKNTLKSIHLVTDSLEPKNTIFIVLDEHYEIPIRCPIKNKFGQPAYIKKLYDIAYIVNVPGKRVDYSEGVADNINNGFFRKREVARYMRTNGYKKPTLVQKSKENTLVLKSDVPVKPVLIKNIPYQHQSLYIDKTI